MKNYNKVFIGACIGQLLFGMVMLSLGTVNTFITSHLNLDENTIGTIAGILPFGILAGSLLFGPILDRFGYKILFIISTIILLITFQGIARANSTATIKISFFLIGLSGGVLNGSTNALVSDISEDKGAKLSLLGVFYGIGALGMPAIMGLLNEILNYQTILSGFGIFMIIPALYFIIIKYPEPKQKQKFPIKKGLKLLVNLNLLLMGMFLFFESGIEGIANNWSTTYLTQDVLLTQNKALFTLSIMIFSLSVTRLILGTVLKKIKSHIVLAISLCIAFLGGVIMLLSNSFPASFIGMILLGIGTAAGFPVILGYVGTIFPELSGTAFSVAFFIALVGNMLINKFVGFIAGTYGIKYFLVVLLTSIIFMFILLRVIVRRISGEIENN